jgi:hypothetical protein
VDAPTERLPIYEAVLSQWFRADEASGQAYGATNGHENGAHENGHSGTVVAPEPQEAPAPPPVHVPPEKQDPVGPLPTRVPGRAGAAAGFGMQDRLAGKETVASRAGNGMATNGSSYAESNGAGDSWQTPADEGWQRAEALLAPVSETTTAGLPKRVPKAHLVPGSAAPRPEPSGTSGTSGSGRGRQATTAPPSLPPRTADAVRGRMSSFQQGLRRGRHTLIEAYSGEASHPSAHRADEEQE